MLKRILYFLLAFALLCPLWASETKDPDPLHEWSKKLPVVVRHDARQFCQAVRFESLPENPYAMYFRAALLGKTFESFRDPDEALQTSLSRLITQEEGKGRKSYFLKVFNIKTGGSRRFGMNHNKDLTAKNTEFRSHFSAALDALTKEKNIYAFFVQGFITYDHGILTKNESEKKRGERYFQCAANLYCLPALNFLSWLYNVQGSKKLSGTVEKKIREYGNLSLPSPDAHSHVRYVIERSVFQEVLMPSSSYCPCKRKGRNFEDEVFRINYAEKFASSVLEEFRLNKIFYGEALAHLTKTTGGMWRTSSLTTQSCWWRLVSVGAPLLTAGVSAFQLWYTYTTPQTDVSENTPSILASMARNAFATGAVSITSLLYNTWILYKTPDIAKLDRATLERESALAALYVTVTNYGEVTPKAGEVRAERIINEHWFNKTGACCKGWFSKKPTLSQQILLER